MLDARFLVFSVRFRIFIMTAGCISVFNGNFFFNYRMAEAESILTTPGKAKVESPIDTIVSIFGDSAPFACKLFASVCSQTERTTTAKDAYLRSLKLNPFLWDSYSKICNLGENVDPTTVFQVSCISVSRLRRGSEMCGANLVNEFVSDVCNTVILYPIRLDIWRVFPCAMAHKP